MARYAYDVNTTQRYIDVHKQFQGGLKTVDTDDALGAVFLRQAENVSLSEFGFIEKRYGTYENFKKQISGTILQGYFEFKGYVIYVIDGKFYVNDETNHRAIQQEKPNEWRYPTLPPYPFAAPHRDVNAVNVNEVLYIFTGVYPVYAKVVDEELKFYWFSVDVPTYDEIVVVGHNLLEDDYEGLYFSEPESYSPNGLSSGNIEKPIELREVDGKIQSNFAPKIPFADNGVIDFKFQYVIDEKYTLTDFDPANNKNKYIEIGLDSIQYRNSGPGASNLDFINLDISSINFPVKNNYIGSQNINLIRGFDLLSKQLSSQELDISITASQAPGFTNYEFDFSISDDFTKEIFLENKTKIYTVEYSTGDPFNPYGVFKFDIDFFKEKFGLSAIPNARFSITYDLEVIPLDSDGLEYPDLKVVYGSSELEFLNGLGYNFVLPSTLAAPEAITKYRLNFNGLILFSLTIAESEDYNAPETFRKRVSYTEKILILDEDQQIQNFPDLSVQISNLLSGTYDFKINYYFKSFSYENDILGIFNTEDGVKIGSLSFYNITITAEKLQDFPRKDENSIGIEYPTLKPIWTCNKVIEHFNKLMVWGSTEMPTAVFYSFPDRPTFFPSKFYLDFQNDEGSPVENITSYMNILVAQTADRTWGVRGNSGLIDAPAPYIPFTINPTVGTIAYKSVRPVRNHLFFLSKQGMIALKSLYAADEQYNIEFVDRNIRNIVPQDTKAVGIQYDNQYWLNFPNFGITLRWYIDKKAWVLDSFGSYTNRITNTYVSKLGAWNNFNGIFKWQIINGQLEFITYPSRFPSEGNPHIYKIGIDYSLPADLGSNVYTKLETSYLNQNYPFHPKNYKELKLDFTIQNEYNLSRGVIYSMDTNEDIVNDIHKIDNVELIKNHRYRILYNFSEHSIDEDILDGGDFSIEASAYDIISGGDFNETDYTVIGAITFSLLGAQDLQITSVVITDKDNNQTVLSQGVDFLIVEESDFDEYIEFLLPNHIDGIVDIIVNGQFSIYDNGAVMYDVTYDNNLQINNWVVSEESTLNLDNIESYDQAKAQLDVNFDSRLGEWVFGDSDFGNKITAVKTVKLSGRGYNAKLYLEDITKSKWTIESLGITYKMRRARSR
jgi:hypothetical protein